MTQTVDSSKPIALTEIFAAYSDVTLRMREAYEQLAGEVERLNDELADKNRELARRERLAALGQLAAGLSHEVRNPLGGIALYASMLERDLADRPREIDVVRKISGAVRSLDRLVGEILEFAQEGVLECQETAFGAVLQPVLENLSPWLTGRDVVVHQTLGADEAPLWCDVSRMQRVILNILVNAVQAMGEYGQIVISASRTTEGTRIEISDTGPGIPDDRIEKIFDPFFTTRSSGTGLGLAIVHQIVAGHGGRVSVSNREKSGALFVIEMPDRSAACAISAEPIRASADGAAGSGRKRIPSRLAS